MLLSGMIHVVRKVLSYVVMLEGWVWYSLIESVLISAMHIHAPQIAARPSWGPTATGFGAGSCLIHEFAHILEQKGWWQKEGWDIFHHIDDLFLGSNHHIHQRARIKGIIGWCTLPVVQDTSNLQQGSSRKKRSPRCYPHYGFLTVNCKLYLLKSTAMQNEVYQCIKRNHHWSTSKYYNHHLSNMHQNNHNIIITIYDTNPLPIQVFSSHHEWQPVTCLSRLPRLHHRTF